MNIPYDDIAYTPELNSRCADILKEKAEALGMSWRQFSTVAGLGHSALAKIATEGRALTLYKAIKLINTYCFSAAESRFLLSAGMARQKWCDTNKGAHLT